MHFRRLATTVAFLLLCPLVAFAGAFTPGDLVIYRVGDGSAALGSTGTAVFLDEYTPAGVFVQSVPMPTSASPRLVASGTATTEGFLTLSEDGRFLVVPGYDGALGATVTSSTTVPRVIGTVNGNGAIDLTTSYVDASSAGNIRSAASVDGTRFWTSGSTQGPRTIAHGATTATVVSTTNTNTRQINIFADQLYIGSGASTIRLGTVGVGLPTTAGQTTTTLPGFPATVTVNSFFFAHLGTGVGLDTVYVADEGGNQISKWTLSGATWTQSGSVPLTTARGLTGVVNGTSVTLYATSGGTGTPVVTFTDSTGFGGLMSGNVTTLIGTAGTNKAFRGIALAPSGGVITVPTTPTGLTATPGNAHVALAWTAVTGATSYNVKRGNTTGGPYTTIASPTTNSYDDTTAVNGTLYFYVVSAVNSAGESGNSTEVSAMPVAPSTSPSGTGTANPNSVQAGRSTTLTVNVTPGSNPTSTGIGVRADLTAIGGSNSQAFTDNGGNSFSFLATVSGNTTGGAKTLPVTITDAQGRSGPASISLTVTVTSEPPTGTASTNPSSVLPGASTTITVVVTPGTNPASSGITVTGDLSAIGGSATQSFTDGGNNTFSFTAIVSNIATVGGKSLPITTADAQGRHSTTTASLVILPTTAIRISQVYGGGGNSGSTYTNDFIELYNSGATPVSLDGWSVQEASSTASSWASTLLSGTIQPGHYYLVQESQGAGGTTPLPAPDASGTIAVSSTSAKVALVASTSALIGTCPVDVNIVDFVGYGGANCSETAPTPALVNTTAAIRKNNGCVDTNNNANDFIIGGPIPRNSASPANDCGGDPTHISGFGIASPNALEPAANTLLTVSVTPATASSGITVSADLTAIAGSANQLFNDVGGNTFTFEATLGRLVSIGLKSMLATITDAQGRTAFAPITLTVVSPTCGVERWSVKVGVDTPDALAVDLGHPVRTTISNLADPLQFPAPPDPPGPPSDRRVMPAETTVYTVNGTLTLYKKEADVDYHIVLQDDSGKTMVTEIPSPACIITTVAGQPRVPAPSPFAQQIASARAKFDAHFTASSLFQTANVPVQVTGVGFFDFIHGQTGVAPNGIELHPVLDINFTSPSTTTISSSPNPSQYQQHVTLTSNVSNSAGTTPTGKVTFVDGTTVIGTSALENGVATMSTTFSVGSHTVMATYEGDSTSATSHSGGLTQVVNRADQTIAFDPIADRTYGDADFPLSASASSSLAVSFSVVSGPVTISGNSVHITGAGYVVLRASQAGDGNYNAAPDATQTFTIKKADQTIVFNPLADKSYGDAPFNVTATGGASGNAITFAASGNCTSSVATITISGAGSCTVTALQSGDANYNDASLARTFKINKAFATVNVAGFSGIYNAQPHGASGSAHGVFGEDLSSLLNLGAVFTDVPGGTAFWSFAENANYKPADGTVAIVIQKATPVIVVDGGTPTYDGATHSATASSLGVNGVSVAGSYTFMYNNSPTLPVNAGTYAVNVAFTSTDGNYSDASGNGTLTIRQATPVVIVTGGPFVYDGLPKSASATASYRLANGTNVTVSGTFTFTYVPTPPVLPATYGVTAAFASSDPNFGNTSGTGALVIIGLREDLQNQANALKALRDATTNRQDLDRLNSAIAHLGEALDPDVWRDSIHGTTADGDEIFGQTKNAVISIVAMLNDSTSTVSKTALQQILTRITIDDRTVAQTAINDAVTRGGDARSIGKARTELTSADADIAAGRYESGLEHDRNAWSFATKS